MKQTIQLGALSVLSICISFLFQWYVLTQLGPGMETDALFAGMTLPQLALAVISGSLMHVLVPLLAGEEERRLRHDSWGFFVLVGGLFSLLATILYISAEWWIPLIVPGFDENGKSLTIELARIQIIGMIFASVNGVQLAIYHARQQFVWAEFILILVSACSLLLLIWALPRYGVISAAWISTSRMALQTLLLAPGMGKPVWPDLTSPGISAAWRRIKPLLLGTVYYKTDPMIDRYLLSTTDSGSLSLYYFAQQIYGAASQVLNKAITTPFVPLMSMHHKLGNFVSFRRTYRQLLLRVSVISLVALFFLVLLGKELLTFIVGHGSVSASNVADLWWIMIWLGGMFVGGIAGQICSSSFYARGDTATPARISIYTYTLYIPIKVIVFYTWGVMGLAIETSIYYMINFCVQAYLLEKELIL